MQVLYVGLTILLLACWTIFDKLALNSVHPIMVQIVTSLVGLCLLPAFYYVLPKPVMLNASGLWWAAASGLCAIGGTATYLMAISKGNVSTITGYTATYPLLTFLLAAVFLGEAFSWIRCVGVACIVAGAVLLGL